MITPKPKFVDLPYFVGEINNWNILDGAPKEVVKEFEAFMAMETQLTKYVSESRYKT